MNKYRNKLKLPKAIWDRIKDQYTEEDFENILKQSEKSNKYRNKKTVVDNITFHSKKEAAYYSELKLLERIGAIKNLELQPVFEIIPSVKWNGKILIAKKYKADFKFYQDGNKVIVDVKGIRTKDYILKRQLFLINYPEYVFKEV